MIVDWIRRSVERRIALVNIDRCECSDSILEARRPRSVSVSVSVYSSVERLLEMMIHLPCSGLHRHSYLHQHRLDSSDDGSSPTPAKPSISTTSVQKPDPQSETGR